jgi:hypothetical protein
MPFVPAQCPNCNGRIQVDSLKEAAVCESCDTAFIVEKAITNYTTHITADVVQVMGGHADFRVEAGILKAYTGSSPNVVIPDNVRIIGHEAFASCRAGVTSVHIPASVRRIKGRAFEKCALVRIEIPATVEYVGHAAFSESSVAAVKVAGSMDGWGEHVFNRCLQLRAVSLAPGTKELPANLFCSCTSLSEITLPQHTASIGQNAFSGTGLRQIVFPTAITRIEAGAFEQCPNLASLQFPRGLIAVGSSAFAGCTGLTSVSLPPNLASLGRGAFAGCTALTAITGFSASLRDIGQSAFSSAPLRTIPEGVSFETLNSSAFDGTQIQMDARGERGLCLKCGKSLNAQGTRCSTCWALSTRGQSIQRVRNTVKRAGDTADRVTNTALELVFAAARGAVAGLVIGAVIAFVARGFWQSWMWPAAAIIGALVWVIQLVKRLRLFKR